MQNPKMNSAVKKLYDISRQSQRLIIGLMSGTSLDGLDVALCRFAGTGQSTQVEVLQFTTVSYKSEFKDEIRAVFGKTTVDLQLLSLLNEKIGITHGKMVLDCISSWGLSPAQVDLIASHGQTVFHAPKWFHKLPEYGNATLQIGDGDHIAEVTGIITLSDFRQKHLAAGGEGAPLAVYGDFLLFADKKEDRILLNMGGIANFTFLPSGKDDRMVFSTDTGPGNTLIDATVRKYYKKLAYDENGKIAQQGKINPVLLKSLLNHSFFSAPLPKTTGPELFDEKYIVKAMQNVDIKTIDSADLIATLTRFSAETIANSIQTLGANMAPMLYMSGGGIHNPVLVAHLKELLPQCGFATTQVLGIQPDAKEAVLFAVLANETIAGGEQIFKENQYQIPAVRMGKISLPD